MAEPRFEINIEPDRSKITVEMDQGTYVWLSDALGLMRDKLLKDMNDVREYERRGLTLREVSALVSKRTVADYEFVSNVMFDASEDLMFLSDSLSRISNALFELGNNPI